MSTGTAAVVRVRSLEITPCPEGDTFDALVQVAQQRLTDGLPGVQVGERTAPPAVAVPRRRPAPGCTACACQARDDGVGLAAGGGAGGAALVVLPTYTWQFANPYDARRRRLPRRGAGPQGLDRPLGDGARVGLEELLRLAGPAMTAAGPQRRDHRPAHRGEGHPEGARLLLVPACASGRRACATGCGRSSPRRPGALIASPLDRRALRDGTAIEVGRRAPTARS